MQDLLTLLEAETRAHIEPLGVFLEEEQLGVSVACSVQRLGALLAHPADTRQAFHRRGLFLVSCAHGRVQDLVGRVDDDSGIGFAVSWNLSDLLELGHRDVLQLGVAQAEERIDHVLRHTVILEQRAAGLGHDGPEPALRDDVEVPTGQLSRQAHILTASADGEGQLVIRNDQLHRHVALVHQDSGDFGGADGRTDEASRIRIPGHDVDLLSAELLNDGLNTATAHTDACADRIDVAVGAVDGDLGSCSRLAGDRDDLYDALADLGHFLLEQFDHEAWIGAREHDLRVAAGAADLLDPPLNSVTGPVGLAGRLLLDGQDRVSAAEVDNDVAFLEASHDAVDELGLAVLEVVVDHLALRLSDALDNDLLGSLGGDSSKRGAGALELENLAEFLVLLRRPLSVGGQIEDLEEQLIALFGVQAESGGGIHRDFPVDVVDVFDHDVHLKELDLAGLFVVLGLDIALVTERSFGGGLDRRFDRLDEDLAVDTLVLPYPVDDLAQLIEHYHSTCGSGRLARRLAIETPCAPCAHP